MTRPRSLVGAVLLLGGLCGCNTTQPLNLGTRTAQVNLYHPKVVTCYVNVWDRFIDSNRNGQVDPDIDLAEPPLCCGLPVPGNPNPCAGCIPPPPGQGATVAVPIAFAVQITVIRAGTVDREVLTSAAAVRQFSSHTDSPPILGLTEDRAPEPCADAPTATCVFANPRLVPTTNVDASNCSQPGNAQIPPDNIGGGPAPFEFQVNPGDTVLVEAGSSSTDPAQQFTGSLAIGGQVLASQTTTVAEGGRLSFSFTVR